MSGIYSKAAALGSFFFGCAAFWRAGLAIQHYRASVAISADPSGRELEEVLALFELGLAIILVLHAVAAAYFIRNPIKSNGIVVAAVALLVGVITAGSFLHIPFLSVPGLLPVSLVIGCSIAGFYTRAPWTSAYLGAVGGGLAGFYFAAPAFEPFAMLAVVLPPVVFAMVGVAFGRLIRRFVPPGQVA